MKINCIRCKAEYETMKKLCNTCYDKMIFKGQCLKIAANALNEYNPEHYLFLEKLFKLARQIYENGTGEKVDEKKKFSEW